MEKESIQQILKQRKEIEQALVDMLEETESDFSLQDVKNAIYHEEGNDDMMKVVAMFNRGGDMSELSDILELATDAWNYFPHKTLGGISPAEKILRYEQDGEKIKQKVPAINNKLTEKQKDLLWSAGGKGPYSQVNLIKQIRILDDSVSRVFIIVEAEINPTTFEIIKANRNSIEFKNDQIIQQLLDHADYRGTQFGYVVAAFQEEFTEDEVLIRAENVLRYTRECVIKMHKYVMYNYKV